MLGLILVVAIFAYGLICAVPCLVIASKHQEAAKGLPNFWSAALLGLSTCLLALFLAVYLKPLLEGKAYSILLGLRHFWGFHTLALILLMLASCRVLRSPNGLVNGFFYGAGLSSFVWPFTMGVPLLLPIELSH